MELRHLRYFVAVAEELNFRRAAERLHVVQPALSRQIKDLESELKVRLLDRDTVRVRLTDAGHVFLEEAVQILAHAECAGDLAREAAAGRRGRLAVGNIGPVTASFMSSSLTAFRKVFPDVAVTLMEIEPADQISALESGLIQVGFTVEKDPALPAFLRKTMVLRSPMCAIVGSTHRLAGKKITSLVELTGERMLMFAGHKLQTHADLVRGLFAASGFKIGSVKNVEGFESLLAMIVGGQGISVMPQHILPSAADQIEIIPLKETGDALMFELSAIWHESETSALARNFVDVLCESIKIPPRGKSTRRPAARLRRKKS